jgi:ATPase subunit of ABC transporter with duplicated ATPase domains
MNIQEMMRAFLKNSFIGTLMIAVTLAMTQPPQAWAMLAPSDVMNAAPTVGDSRAADLKTIQATLESKMVRQRLSEFKLTPDQVNQRMSQLSDAQVHQVALQIRTLNPGGDAGLGIIVGLLVIGILVLLFVYLFRRV